MIIDDLYKVTMLQAGWLIIFDYLNPLEAFVYAIGIIVLLGFILLRNFKSLSEYFTTLLGDWR